MTIIYRTLHSPEEIAPITDLEILVWEMSGRDAIPSHIAQVIVKCGGNIIGAYDDATSQMVGFTLALMARDFIIGEGVWLWSHMAAVHPDYQRQGIGLALKHAQRDWALEQGFTRMGWTFDPLMAPNANFNMRLLGATTRTYKRNHYGIMTDGLNAGFPSDRFIVEWDLNAPRTQAHITGSPAPLLRQDVIDTIPFVLTIDRDAPVLQLPSRLDAPYYAVALHSEIATLKRTQRPLAQAWQQALAEVFTRLLHPDEGYRVTDYVRHDGHGFYVVQR